MFHGDTILCTGLKRCREDSKHDLEAYDKRKPVGGGEGKGCSPLTSWFTSSLLDVVWVYWRGISRRSHQAAPYGA
jgi:hypothetical protein